MELQDQNPQNESGILRWHAISISIATIGFLLSAYGVYHHRLVQALGKSGAFCNISATVNCDAMALSAYSRFLSVPWGVWGMGYFLAVILLLGFSFKRLGNRQEHLLAFGFLVVIGWLVSAILGFISYKYIGVICLLCLSIYVVNLANGILLWLGIRNGQVQLGSFNFKKLYSGMVSSALAMSAVLIAYAILGEQMPTTPASEAKYIESSDKTPLQLNPKVDIPVFLSPYSGSGEDFRKGPENAKLTLILFSDFECPGCRGVSAVIEEIYNTHAKQIRLVYKNYPLDQSCNPIMQNKMHEHACQLAILARCAGQYGKFWAYHDLAFEKQGELNGKSPFLWAKQVGLTDEQTSACMKDKSLNDKIQDDIAVGTKLGINGTPTVFLNGRQFHGRWSELKDEVKKVLEE